MGLAAISTAAALALGPANLGAAAVTNEQLLFLEAWRAVDRAYVDKSFNGQSWFKVGTSSPLGNIFLLHPASQESQLAGRYLTRYGCLTVIRSLVTGTGDIPQKGVNAQ